MPGWPRLPSAARSLRTWVSVMPRASPSEELETRATPSRESDSSRRRYRLSRPTLARERRASGATPVRFLGSSALDMLAETGLLSGATFLSVEQRAGAVNQAGAPRGTGSLAAGLPTSPFSADDLQRTVPTMPLFLVE